jgi:primosomal protein N' (replication factor Y)
LRAEVALLSPPFGTLSYQLPAGFPEYFWKAGLRLAVPLGRGLRSAVLLRRGRAATADPEGFILKEVVWPLEREPILSEAYLDFARQFALRQAQPEGRMLAGMLPPGLRILKNGRSWLRLRFFDNGLAEDFDLPELQALSGLARARLAALWLAGQGQALRGGEEADLDIYGLRAAPPWPLRPSASRQLALLEYIFSQGRGRVSRRQILRELGPDYTQSLRQLLARGLLAKEDPFAESPAASSADLPDAAAWLRQYRPVLESPPPFELNPEQRAALADLEELMRAGKPATRLLYGVTGSGKTAVYLELCAKTLLSGKSALLLVPEVALALKLRRDIQERFPGLPLYFFHGYQSAALRENIFRDLAHRSAGRAPALVLGTRSALFLEIPNLGALILDEEHDSSFKQDERLYYQAKDLAWFRSGQYGAPLVLGSATPDVKTFYAAEQGRIRMHRLSGRVGGGELPRVSLAPLGAGASSTSGLLAPESARALRDCLARGEQAMILLNRRGYAPAMYCLECGTSARCPNCEISLTYHKKREKLVCHYCGFSQPFPSPCATCKSTRFLPLGEGTEKLEERLQSFLPPGARVLRLDRDSTGRPGDMENILSAFGRGEAEVLLGTQMLSKGHHFPRVTLAILADGDQGLNIPDYNAAERTFQLLVQASGRSGRGELPGRVIIQTRDPGHYCWEYVKNNDYEGFYRQELARRELRRYPPFVRLALVRLSFPPAWAEGPARLAELSRKLKAAGQNLGVEVLGPAPAPHPMREGRLRYQYLLKGQDWKAIRGVYAALEHVPSGHFRVSLDIDPGTML